MTFPWLELHLVEDLGQVVGISRVVLVQRDIDLLQLVAIEDNPTSLVQKPLSPCNCSATAL